MRRIGTNRCCSDSCIEEKLSLAPPLPADSLSTFVRTNQAASAGPP
jgi:hypothetical protein